MTWPTTRGSLRYDDAPIALLEVDGRPSEKGDKGQKDKKDKKGICAYVYSAFTFGKLFEETCQTQYLLARNEATKNQLMVPMELEGDADSPVLLAKINLDDQDSESAYAVNGDDKIIGRGGKSIRPPMAPGQSIGRANRTTDVVRFRQAMALMPLLCWRRLGLSKRNSQMESWLENRRSSMSSVCKGCLMRPHRSWRRFPDSTPIPSTQLLETFRELHGTRLT